MKTTPKSHLKSPNTGPLYYTIRSGVPGRPRQPALLTRRSVTSPTANTASVTKRSNPGVVVPTGESVVAEKVPVLVVESVTGDGEAVGVGGSVVGESGDGWSVSVWESVAEAVVGGGDGDAVEVGDAVGVGVAVGTGVGVRVGIGLGVDVGVGVVVAVGDGVGVGVLLS